MINESSQLAAQSFVPHMLDRKTAALQLESVSVSFDGFKALNNLSLSIYENDLLCVIGPNGAGKTTMLDVMTGKTNPDEGTIMFSGRSLNGLQEATIANLGIGRKFQQPSVFAGHTVWENLELLVVCKRSVWHGLCGILSKSQKERIEEVLHLIGLKDHRSDQAALLSHGQKQWLELGMLLVQDPQVLLVDEPVAGMTHFEVEKTAELLMGLRKHHAVVVVDHDMNFIRSIGGRVVVLHEGAVLAEGSMEQVSTDPKVIQVYLGESLC